jgi:hypothetical protein
MGDLGPLGGARSAAVRHLVEATSCRIGRKRHDASGSLRGSPGPTRRPGNLAPTSLPSSPSLLVETPGPAPVGSGLSLREGFRTWSGECSPPAVSEAPRLCATVRRPIFGLGPKAHPSADARQCGRRVSAPLIASQWIGRPKLSWADSTRPSMDRGKLWDIDGCALCLLSGELHRGCRAELGAPSKKVSSFGNASSARAGFWRRPRFRLLASPAGIPPRYRPQISGPNHRPLAPRRADPTSPSAAPQWFPASGRRCCGR